MNLLKRLSPLRLPAFKIVIIGVILRLLASLLFTHTFDSFTIIALSKSIADTGQLFPAFQKIAGTVQLYGKVYYQVIGLWMKLLDSIHILDLRYIFDVKAYKDINSYLLGFDALSPELYQLAVIKLIQLVYDFLLLFFLVKIAKILNLQNRKAIILFWAINPLFIYVGYVILQSDLAMVSMLTGAVYFSLKALKDEKKRLFSLWGVLAVLFIAVGAVIKQVPILILPFTLLLISSSIWEFIIYTFLFFVFYYVSFQPWSVDAVIMKKYFLTSPESLNLFNYALNGVTIFFFLYILAFGFFVKILNKVKKDPLLFLKFVTLIIAIVFVSEDAGYFFVQFSIWIMPFLALLSLSSPAYGFFLLGSLIGFYLRVLSDGTVLAGSASSAFGGPMHFLPDYEKYLGKIINYQIIKKFWGTIFSIFFLGLIAYIIGTTRNKSFMNDYRRRFEKYFSLENVSIGIFLIFIFVFILETGIRSRNASLTNYVYKNTSETAITKTPISLTIKNSGRHTITGVEFHIRPVSKTVDDYIVVSAVDPKTKKILTTGIVSDQSLPDKESNETISFSKGINNEEIEVKLYKKNGNNQYMVSTSKDIERVTKHPRLDNFYKKGDIGIVSKGKTVVANVIGVYSIQDAIQNLFSNIQKKPKFFVLYFGLIAFLVVVLLLPDRIFKKYAKLRIKRQSLY